MATLAQETEHLWFLGARACIRVAAAEGEDGITVMEQWAPRGDSPPLHVHDTEDEVFHVVEGMLRVVLDGRELELGAGETVLAPKGVPHTYRVESETAHWLVVTTGGDFERFVRALSRPAETDGLPQAQPPTEAEVAELAATARAHGIQLVGPPLA
jgi:mannose-6-phosphate isomerase-like protein (cupin superfamily)